MTRYRSEIVVCLFLLVSTLAVYGQVGNHGFIDYDDNVYITKNLQVQAGWTREGVLWAFTTKFHGHWHPLTWLSHMTDCQFFGLSPGAHHLTSVFLHIANTLLLFFVLKRMTGASLRSAFVAALFALHPLHVEPVAWVADRKDLLSAFFWMVAMAAYVRYAERPGFQRYVLVVIAFLFGLMAKSMVVTLPFVLLLLDYWPLERFEFGPSSKRKEDLSQTRKVLEARYQSTPTLRLVWEKVLFFALVGGALVVTVLFMAAGSRLAEGVSSLLPATRHITHALVYYVSYIRKMLWPCDLAIPYPEVMMPSAWKIARAGLILAGLSFLALWKIRRYPYLAVGWLWYLITLLPVIGLVPIGPHKMADRYTYVPLIGLFIIIAWGVPDLLKGWRSRTLVLGLSSGLLLLALMMGAWLQVRHWKNSISLFKHTVGVTANNDQGHYNLGSALAKEGRLGEAIHHYLEAIRIQPDYAQAHNDLGVSLTEQGRLDEAMEHYSEAIRIRPGYAQAHYNLGVALTKQGRLKEAVGHYAAAVRIKPDYVKARHNLELGLRLLGKSP